MTTLHEQETRLFAAQARRALDAPGLVAGPERDALRRVTELGGDRGMLACALAADVRVDADERARRWNAVGMALEDADRAVDMVNRPPHYTAGPIECLDLAERYPGCMFSAIRYVYRHRGKWNPVEDLDKAAFYVRRAMSNGDGLAPVGGLDAAGRGGMSVRSMLGLLAERDWAGARGFWLALAGLDGERALAELDGLRRRAVAVGAR